MKLFRAVLRVIGVVTIFLGFVTVVWLVGYLLQHETGWGLSAVERLGNDQYGKAALGGILGGMFFLVSGCGALLVSHMGLRPEPERKRKPMRWLGILAIVMFVCGVGAIALATLFAGMSAQFGEYTTGVVSYCMMTGVGLLVAAWGLRRASQIE